MILNTIDVTLNIREKITVIMTSWMPSFGGFLRRSRSESEVLSGPDNNNTVIPKQTSLDLDILPEVEGESEILSLEDIKRLSDVLPARIIGTGWRLVFSTSHHGFSLGSLYRKFDSEDSSPTLLCIEDTEGEVFGALVSCPVKLRDTFYGTGESFLFTSQPRWELYPWSGDNQLFVRGNTESLVVGAGDGQFGLYIDSSLYQGRSQPCQTYLNKPLARKGDFILKTLECWSFS